MLPVTQVLDHALHPELLGEDAGSARASLRFVPAGRAPLVVVWNICHHCNMRCPHCYAAATFSPSAYDLSSDEGVRLIDQIADAGVRVLILSGGEPLLRADVFDLAAHATARGLDVQLSTNGVLIDDDVAARLRDAGVHYVGVSIDGTPEFNDVYRGLERGYDRARAGLDAAMRAGLATGVRVTVTRRNAAQVDALLDEVLRWGVGRFYVSHLVDSGRSWQVSGDDLSPEETRGLLERLFARAEALLAAKRKLRVVTGANDSAGPLLVGWIARRHGEEAASRARSLLARRGGNSAGEKILNVDARGRVHPDQFWRQATLADVRREPFERALSHPLRADLARREELLEGRCGACRFLGLCRGSHRERALARSGGLWAPDPACVMRDDEIGVVASAARAASRGGAR